MKSLLKLSFFTLLALNMASCNLIAAAGIGSQGQPIQKVEDTLTSTTANSNINVDHSDWDRLLKTYVNAQGLVNYKAFKKEQSQLDAYLQKLAQLEPNNDWSVQELLAYYINLYNAATVDLILQNYPIKSIKDIDGAFTKSFISIGTKKLSLSAIENGVLRKMNEPRIHFAINCASFSCPKLMREAYTAAKINEQLEAASSAFINSENNHLTYETPELSKIFDFYTSDFKVNGKQDVIGFINNYSKTPINPKAIYTFKPYDWNLNEQH